MTPSTSNTVLAVQQLAQLRAAFAQLAQQQLSPAVLGNQARSSGALFTEESCSFSHTELMETLEQWASKAQSQLELAQAR